MIIIQAISEDDHTYAYAACNDDASANSEGFREDILCPRNFSKNPVYLNYNIATSSGHTITRLSLYENNSTREIVKYVIFYIAINTTENTKQQQQPSFHDFFKIENTILVLDFVHKTSVSNNSSIPMEGAYRDPFSNSWIPSHGSNKITINNFPLAANKTYDMHVEIFGTDNPRIIFTSEQAPKVDFVFSTNENHDSEGKVLVVPEFGSVDGVLIAAAFLAFMVVGVRSIRNRIRG